MKTLRICTGSIICLALAACGNGAPPKDKAASAEQDLTASAVPAMTGTYASPNAHLRIYNDGRFALETSAESVRWYVIAQPNPEQHYASCKFLRKGRLQVIKRDEKTFLRFNIAERHLLKADKDSRSPNDDPVAVCDKVMGILGTKNAMNLWLSAEGNKQLLISRNDGRQPYFLDLEYASQGGILADTNLYGEFALLFAPQGATTDVSDLVSTTLTATYKPQIEADTDRYALELSPEFRTLRYVNADCQIDTSLNIHVVSTGNRILIRSAGSHGNPSSDTSNANTGDTCSARRSLLSAREQQALFDITDPRNINGIGALNGVSFRKIYRN